MPSSSPFSSYPRPDFHRIDTALRWSSLDGDAWDFLFDDSDAGLQEQWHRTGLPESVSPPPSSSDEPADTQEADGLIKKIVGGVGFFSSSSSSPPEKRGADLHKKRPIKVPFAFQTEASGINERGAHEVVWYERKFTDLRHAASPSATIKAEIEELRSAMQRRLLLRFGAVDYEATVWIDGQYVGFHRGGHVPFSFDISDHLSIPSDLSFSLRKEMSQNLHRLTIRVRDSPYDLTQPRGKQYWKPQPESIFYTPSTGIWQPVWLEDVPALRIADSYSGTVLRSDDIQTGELRAKVAVRGRRAGQRCSVQIEASLAGVKVATSERKAFDREIEHVSLSLNLRLSTLQRQDLPPDLLQSAPLEFDASQRELLVKEGEQPAWREGLALWSPEHPTLYDISIKLYDDSTDQLVDHIHTTAGMRSLSWSSSSSPPGTRGAFKLNGQPYFHALVLDQGYWPYSGMTPPDVSADGQSLKRDIELTKKMGFNGCRKHQKVEDPRFFYWADKLGFLVWGEMANAYEFSEEYVERFNAEWTEAVKRDINHPSIVAWTPVNESWGYTSLKDNIEQRNHIRQLYYLTKALDPTRPINDNCGWEHVQTDLTTFHDYADGPQLSATAAAPLEAENGILGKKAGRDMFVRPVERARDGGDPGSTHRPGAPVLCTEYGGVNIAPAKGPSGSGGTEKDWGYTTASDPSDLLARIESLTHGLVKGGHISGFVYTQIVDVEQEVNGLLTFDRQEKLEAAKVKEVIEEAKRIYYSTL